MAAIVSDNEAKGPWGHQFHSSWGAVVREFKAFAFLRSLREKVDESSPASAMLTSFDNLSRIGSEVGAFVFGFRCPASTTTPHPKPLNHFMNPAADLNGASFGPIGSSMGLGFVMSFSRQTILFTIAKPCPQVRHSIRFCSISRRDRLGGSSLDSCEIVLAAIGFAVSPPWEFGGVSLPASEIFPIRFRGQT